MLFDECYYIAALAAKSFLKASHCKQNFTCVHYNYVQGYKILENLAMGIISVNILMLCNMDWYICIFTFSSLPDHFFNHSVTFNLLSNVISVCCEHLLLQVVLCDITFTAVDIVMMICDILQYIAICCGSPGCCHNISQYTNQDLLILSKY